MEPQYNRRERDTRKKGLEKRGIIDNFDFTDLAFDGNLFYCKCYVPFNFIGGEVILDNSEEYDDLG